MWADFPNSFNSDDGFFSFLVCQILQMTLNVYFSNALAYTMHVTDWLDPLVNLDHILTYLSISASHGKMFHTSYFIMILSLLSILLFLFFEIVESFLLFEEVHARKNE